MSGWLLLAKLPGLLDRPAPTKQEPKADTMSATIARVQSVSQTMTDLRRCGFSRKTAF